jgi:cytochrome c peroxidase
MRYLYIVLAALYLVACRPAKPTGTVVSIPSPLGLPPLVIPASNPPTADTIALGKKLYFSTLLSVDRSLSCANCHDPKTGFADIRPVSIGIHGSQGKRNAPTILNAAFNSAQFWDGRADSLEAQVSGPMLNSIEMGHTLEGVERAVSNDAELRPLFEKAFGPGPPTMDKITKAIASYERTLLSGNSPFDRFTYGGDVSALSEAARRGIRVFTAREKGNCVVCHTIDERYALFTDGKFHNLGVGLNPEGELTDQGHGNGTFKTPSLRNVAKTAPYMHDGSLKSLKEVVDFYVGGGSSNPFLDKEIKPLTHLTGQERADLVAFLESLTGEIPQ